MQRQLARGPYHNEGINHLGNTDPGRRRERDRRVDSHAALPHGALRAVGVMEENAPTGSRPLFVEDERAGDVGERCRGVAWAVEVPVDGGVGEGRGDKGVRGRGIRAEEGHGPLFERVDDEE